MSRDQSSNQTAILEKHAVEHMHREPISFSEPTMFWVGDAGLRDYLRLELERLNTADNRA